LIYVVSFRAPSHESSPFGGLNGKVGLTATVLRAM